MKLVTKQQMQAFEARVIQTVGIPEKLLMERAGLAIADKAAEMMEDCCCSSVLVVCGTGNNGGDGLVAARELINRGYDVETVIFGTKEKLKAEPLFNCHILLQMGHSIHFVNDPQDLAKLDRLLEKADLIIDALFGFGLDRPVAGLEKDGIHKINQSGCLVLAVDLPSGIHADTGVPLGAAIKADVTLTFGMAKRGLYSDIAADHTGIIEVADIGFPQKLLDEVKTDVELLQPETLRELLPVRPQSSHKGSYGKLAVVAGSEGMAGAAILTTQGALRGGAGWVKAFLPQSIAGLFHEAVPEALSLGYSDPLTASEIKTISEALGSMDGLALGPGLGQSETSKLLVAAFLDQIKKPMVIDGDGLNLLAQNPVRFIEYHQVVLTPHVKEAERLLGEPARIQEDRFRHGLELAKKYNATVLLKGRYTLISTPDGKQWVNPTGNPGMATAGSGDVLTGLIGAFLVQGLNGPEAARLGAYLHGLAGDLAGKKYGELPLKAGDLVEFVPAALHNLLNS